MPRTMTLPVAIIALAGLAACADPQAPPPGPLGLAAEDFPPGSVSPEGMLGDAEVGADSLADPGIDTAGDPFL